MIRSLLPSLLLSGVLFGLLSGCVTETGNPELDVQLRAGANSSRDRVAVSSLPTVTVESAWVILGDVRLVEGSACDTPDEIEHTAEGPFETNLLAEVPEVIHIPAVGTDYCRVRVRLDDANGLAAGPDGLDDHSVYLSGTRGDGLPFVIRSRSGFEVDLRSRGEPFSLEVGAADLLLAFDLGTWLDGVDLDGATPTDGVVTVDEDHEPDLLDAFEDAVDAAMALLRDPGSDGQLDDDDELLAD